MGEEIQEAGDSRRLALLKAPEELTKNFDAHNCQRPWSFKTIPVGVLLSLRSLLSSLLCLQQVLILGNSYGFSGLWFPYTMSEGIKLSGPATDG